MRGVCQFKRYAAVNVIEYCGNGRRKGNEKLSIFSKYTNAIR